MEETCDQLLHTAALKEVMENKTNEDEKQQHTHWDIREDGGRDTRRMATS